MHDFIKELLPELISFRKKLHRFPEVSQKEYSTSASIMEYLSTHTQAQILSVAETGVLAVFDSENPGKTVLLRADIDALPIKEINTFDHRSVSPGVSHKCGHDGHTAILLGVAQVLSVEMPETGKVILLFQPAEENGMGAEAVLRDPYVQDQHIDFVFALHNLPGFKKNIIVIRENNFNANVKSIIIQLHGKTAHAAEPEKGNNPALAIADILHFAEKETNNHPEQEDFFLITPVYAHLGDMAYGISAGAGEVHLTIRSWDLGLLEKKSAALIAFVDEICMHYGLQKEISWTQEFYANMNDHASIDIIKQAAAQNGFATQTVTFPFKWGEDFGLFTQIFPGAMWGLGAGEDTPALHNPDYDFPDDIIATGVQQFVQIIREVL
ncbi:MAG: amidohydrolase [Chitinophagales bacterium]